MRPEGNIEAMDGPLEGSHEWEEQWVLCPCKLCKCQKRRRRRISLQHLQKHGEFDKRLLLLPPQSGAVRPFLPFFDKRHSIIGMMYELLL